MLTWLSPHVTDFLTWMKNIQKETHNSFLIFTEFVVSYLVSSRTALICSARLLVKQNQETLCFDDFSSWEPKWIWWRFHVEVSSLSAALCLLYKNSSWSPQNILSEIILTVEDFLWKRSQMLRWEDKCQIWLFTCYTDLNAHHNIKCAFISRCVELCSKCHALSAVRTYLQTPVCLSQGILYSNVPLCR